MVKSSMRSELSGASAMKVIDETAVRMRKALTEAVAAADEMDARQHAIDARRLDAIRRLADIRLDLIENGSEGSDLDTAHKQAQALMESHEAFVAREAVRLEEAADAIETLEARREGAASARDEAIAAHEARVAEIEAALKTDPSYLALLKASEEASAVAARAEQKHELAVADREEKGEPYEDDPLFAYLWKRRYRTPEYKANPFFRFLDGWVASLCKYDRHWTNYQRLTELPVRLAEHAETVGRLEEEALAQLDAAEARALSEGGADKLAAVVEDRRAALEKLDAELDAAEAEHAARAAAHEAAREERAGPVMQAREVLNRSLAKSSFPELRLLAAQTIALDDDRIVDELVRLRSEEMALDLSAKDVEGLPGRRRYELERVERLRSAFKREGLDTPWVLIAGAVLRQAVDGLIGGQIDLDDAVSVLKRGTRRVSNRSGQDVIFGGREREAGGMFGGILGDVLIEVAKQAARHRGGDFGGGPWGGSSTKRRTSIPRPSFPKSSGGGRTGSRGGGRSGGSGRRSGGFKTGGGF